MTSAAEAIGLPVKPVGPGHNKPGMTCHHWAYHRLTCAQYEDLRAFAGGHCGICKTPEAETRRGFLVVDHFHGKSWASTFIRGMLCDRCNQSVMQCLDGLKAWGQHNRKLESAAREYERNSWERPSEMALAEMAARTEMLPVVRKSPRRWPATPTAWPRPQTVEIPLGKGQYAIAYKLRRHLTPRQIKRLATYLAEEA